MLLITRQQVLAFLQEYHLRYVTDSSNETDQFLRNRLRHHVMPLLKQENPRLAENLSAMALRLRQDEAALAQAPEYRVEVLRQMPQAMRLRAVAADLESWGVPEPEAAHLELVEKLILSDHPSARADLPGGITVCRNCGVLERYVPEERISPVVLKCPGQTVVEALGLRVICEESEDLTCGESYFTVSPRGEVIVRSRQSADRMRLSGGSKSLKKLFVDRKIPAAKRMAVPVIADDDGILGVYGIGVNLDRLEPGIRIRFESL
jgi:tRNA(Ile)-lysidine synthase